MSAITQRALALATVPEHSVPFMEAMSGGLAFIEREHLFYHADDWLIAIGYPLRGAYDPDAFEAALNAALNSLPNAARSRAGSIDCWAIAPQLPPSLAPHLTDDDAYYSLPTTAAPPARLLGPLRKAASLLRVDEGRVFTPAHRRLWTEFLRYAESKPGGMKPETRELFARAGGVLTAPETDLRLLNAWDGEGNLAACLLLDHAPRAFCVYLIGAHSRTRYIPHASDLLFAEMIARARAAGKEYIHLGQGVNEGIRRFKIKWGGKAVMPYQAAAWRSPAAGAALSPRTAGAASGRTAELFSGPEAGVGQALLDSLFAAAPPPRSGDAGLTLFGKTLPPEQRPYAMLWRLEKRGKVSWIGGTAHAFRYSFDAAFRRLFREVDTVILEGPLDPASLAAFSRQGHSRDPGVPPVLDLLAEEEVQRLERTVRGPEGRFARLLNLSWPNPADVRGILAGARPWCVLFTLWHAFLERHGWNQSVDLEAWEIGHDMGRNVVPMESIDEQIASLESVPLDRILNFLRACGTWKARMKRNAATYLAGDLRGMMGTSTEFPSRTELVIDARDQRFRERMRPYIENGRAAVFVGTAHMLNLERMLREDGFAVTQERPTLRHKLRGFFRN